MAEDQREGSEDTLVQRAQRGDEQAFATLYQLHNKRVYSVCLRMTRDVAEAEDLVQEAFMQVFRNLNSFRGDSAFPTWLHRIAVNTVLMKLRSRKSPPLLSLDEPVSSGSPSLKRELGKQDQSLRGAIDRIALRRAIEELPRGARQIFELHEFEGYEHHEIAELLQCSIGNSKSQLHQAILFPQERILRRPRASNGAASVAKSQNDPPELSSSRPFRRPSSSSASGKHGVAQSWADLPAALLVSAGPEPVKLLSRASDCYSLTVISGQHDWQEAVALPDRGKNRRRRHGSRLSRA